jgi:hypothetical protein
VVCDTHQEVGKVSLGRRGLNSGMNGQIGLVDFCFTSGSKRKACEARGPPCIEGAELGDFDEHGEGGGRGRDDGQDREPLGAISIGLKLLEDRGLDRRDPVFDLVEALRILALRQRCGENRAAVLGDVWSLPKASRARSSPLSDGSGHSRNPAGQIEGPSRGRETHGDRRREPVIDSHA